MNYKGIRCKEYLENIIIIINLEFLRWMGSRTSKTILNVQENGLRTLYRTIVY